MNEEQLIAKLLKVLEEKHFTTHGNRGEAGQ